VRESNNPFFQTQASLIGVDLEKEVAWSAPSVRKSILII